MSQSRNSSHIAALLASLLGNALPDGMDVIAIKIDPNSPLSEDEQIEQQIAAARAEHEKTCEKCLARKGEEAVQQAMDAEHDAAKASAQTAGMGTDPLTGTGANQAGKTRKPFGFMVFIGDEPIVESFNVERGPIEEKLKERSEHPLGKALLALAEIGLAKFDAPTIKAVYAE